jgi:hypothetical protein
VRGRRIEPYHVNGLNWRAAPDLPRGFKIPVVIGFMPAWWEKEYGVAFGRDFHLDPAVHRATLIRMEDELRLRFGDIPNLELSGGYRDAWFVERRYGDALVPALFGCGVSFEEASGHPFARCLNLTDEQAASLLPPDVENHPVMRSVLEQGKGGFSRAGGELGFEGVMNVAYKLRGEEIFVDLAQRPEIFRRLCAVVYETIEKAVLLFTKWLDPLGERPTAFVHCDCMINMMSASMYRDELLEYEKKFRKRFDLFGVHTCNWKVDPYLEALAEIGRVDYLDMGAESDLDRVHGLFPDLSPSVFYHPEKVKRLSSGELKKEIRDLCGRIGRGTLLLSDLEAGTPDENIRAVCDAASGFL